MPQRPTVHASFGQLLVEALHAEGFDENEVLNELGLDRHDLLDSGTRKPIEVARALWHATRSQFADPACGITISGCAGMTSFHALGYAVFASTRLREVLERLVRYSPVISDVVEFRVESTPGAVRLLILPGKSALSRAASDDASMDLGPELVDLIMGLLMRAFRVMTDRQLAPLLVEQRRPAPRERAPYEAFFRCPLRFGTGQNAITLASHWVERPLTTGNAALAKHNETLLEKELLALAQVPLSDRVREVLGDWNGHTPVPNVARLLGLSERSLQRHLRAERTSYVQLIAQRREHLACGYLRETHLSIDDVAARLGFHSSSTFARAFRRWTDLSPMTYRKRTVAHQTPAIHELACE